MRNISKIAGFFTKIVVLAALITFSSSAYSVYSQLATKEQQIRALEDMVDIYRYQAGGLFWKQEMYGFDPDEIFERYKSYIENAWTLDEAKGLTPVEEREVLTPNQVRYLFIGLTSEFHDGHVSNTMFNGSATTAGLRTVALHGRLLVAAKHPIHHKPVSEEFEVEAYDEIIEIDGRGLSFYKTRNLNYISNGTIQARKDEALERILEIPHALIPPYSDKPTVKIKFRRGEQEFTNEYEWTTVDTIDLTRPINPSEAERADEMYKSDQEFVFGAKGAVRSAFMEGIRNIIKDQIDSGNHTLKIQDLGRDINMKLSEGFLKITKGVADSFFNKQLDQPLTDDQIKAVLSRLSMVSPIERIKAYVISEEGQKPVAMLRIPSYAPNSFGDVLKEIQFITSVIMSLKESEVDTLIIDQATNPGGYVAYVHMLLRLFATPEEPLVAQKIQYVLNEILFNSYLQTAGLDNMLKGEIQDEELRRKYLEFLREQMEDGMKVSSWLPFNMDVDLRTDDVYGVIKITEDMPYWDKKLVVLTDSRSASGAEFFPAIIQDNDRGLVLGESSPTMGLGNPVVGHIDVLQRAEMRFRCAFAMCRRHNEEYPYIENLGVKGDVQRTIHIEDLKEGLKKNARDILDATYMYREGKSDREIQIALNRTNSLEQARQFIKGDDRLLNEGITQVVQQFRADVAGLNNSIEEDLNDWLLAYTKLFDTLEELEEAREVPHEAWDLVAIPLPDELTKSDYVLKSETRKDVVLRRFEEMLENGSLKDKPNTQILIKHIFNNAYKIQGFFHFNTPCELLFN